MNSGMQQQQQIVPTQLQRKMEKREKTELERRSREKMKKKTTEERNEIILWCC